MGFRFPGNNKEKSKQQKEVRKASLSISMAAAD